MVEEFARARGELDEALVRPGRGFARLYVRELTVEEAAAVSRALCGDDEDRMVRAMASRAASGKQSHSLAEIYRACEQ